MSTHESHLCEEQGYVFRSCTLVISSLAQNADPTRACPNKTSLRKR